MDPLNVRAKFKSVALHVPEIIGVAKKFLEVPGYMPTLPIYKNLMSFPYRLFLYVHSFSGNFWLEFWVGLRISNLGGMEAILGSGLLPFERALMNSYRPRPSV